MASDTNTNWRNVAIAAAITTIIGIVLPKIFPDPVEKKPVASFEYYSENTNKKLAIALTDVKFKNTSKDAARVRWIFPNGDTFSEDSVTRVFPYSDRWDVKLEAFSESGKLTDMKTIECLIFAGLPENLTSIKIRQLKDKTLFHADMKLQIGSIRIELPENSEFQLNGVPKGIQKYAFEGNAMFRPNLHGPSADCQIVGGGTVNIVSGGLFEVVWKDKDNCQLEIVKAD